MEPPCGRRKVGYHHSDLQTQAATRGQAALFPNSVWLLLNVVKGFAWSLWLTQV